MIEFFIDTANIDEIEKARKMGIFSGCTTNPKIIFNTMGNIPYEQGIKKIIEIIPDWPVSIEVTTTNPEEMVKEAKKYREWGENVVIKLPITEYGLNALSYLRKEKIPTNVTLGMSPPQALMAAIGRATYFSLFYCRIRDGNENPQEAIRRTKNLFKSCSLDSKIIVGSIRSVEDVLGAAEAGADIITITPDVVYKMLHHPQTEKSEIEFLEFWDKYNKR